VTLEAQWTPITYTVVFNVNTGSGTMDPQLFTYDIEEPLSANRFTKDGFKFVGWSLSEDAEEIDFTDGKSVSNLTTEDGETINLYAQWTKVYKVTYDINGGVGGPANIHRLNEGDEVEIDATVPTKVTYKFDGWAFNGDVNDIRAPGHKFNMPANDVTLVAQWAPNGGTIVFHSSNGLGETSEQKVYTGLTVKLNRNTFTYEGHIFTGWDIYENTNNVSYQDEQVHTFNIPEDGMTID
jgi:uncharacterized repeat protein (TIGR02543 family)